MRHPREVGIATPPSPRQFNFNCFLLTTGRSRQKDLYHEFGKSRVGPLSNGAACGQSLRPFPPEVNTSESPSRCDRQ
jgi:hypothetical protein